MVALVHLFGLGTERQAQHLMAEADAEDGLAAGDEFLDFGHGVFAGGRRITGAVGQKDAIGIHGEDILRQALAGTTVISQPALVRQRRMLRLRP